MAGNSNYGPEGGVLTLTSENSQQLRLSEDENIEATGSSKETAVKPSKEKNSDIVDWDGPNDPENPMNWVQVRKWTIIALVSAMTFDVFVSSLQLLCIYTDNSL